MMGVWDSWATFAAMIMVVAAQASTMVVNKLAMSGGTNKFILAFYSDAFTSLLILPFIITPGRNNDRPPVTFSLHVKFFLLALLVFVGQIFGFLGIDYSSPTLGSALMNLIPAFTVILAVISRMEKLVWKNKSSQAKVVGTVASITGAFIVTLYKGPPLSMPAMSPSLKLDLSQELKWVLGGLFLAGEALMTASCYVFLQAFIIQEYPRVLEIAFYNNLYPALMFAPLALVVARDPKMWVLKLDKGLVAIIYSTLVGNLLRAVVSVWCLKKRGSVYVAMFKPLGVIFAVLLGALFLGDTLCRGSLIGGVVIVVGFYGVMWGRANESKAMAEDLTASETLPQTTPKTPLLAQEGS